MKAGFMGGNVMAIGAMTWGFPILGKVGKGIVHFDITMGVSFKYSFKFFMVRFSASIDFVFGGILAIIVTLMLF